jgi:hypothetical protein
MLDGDLYAESFLDFLLILWPMTRAFVKGKENLEHRLSERTLVPDPDGLYRIEDFSATAMTGK